ncbi:MAG: 50S ribosomal protein L2 [Candidatus Nealsonbacteria bacterium]|nr:50S ribosomal protein L2 [Candidatus Nealsonbacteria bacterium]
MLKNTATKLDFSLLTKKEPEKRLLLRIQEKAGRGEGGRITVRHQGGGVKRLYRIIDFGQEKINIKGSISAFEYDPYRNAFIALIKYDDGDKRYVIAPQGLKIGDEVICQESAPSKIGNRMKLKNIQVGSQVFNIEIEPGRGGKLAKSAGSSARLLASEGKYVQLEMPSGEVREILQECFATVGSVSRPEYKYIKLGKAGRTRYRGIRPTVRGTAMNAVDHPHGGGEGKTPIGLKYPKTPWGKIARGVKTRRRGWTDKFILQRRKKKN